MLLSCLVYLCFVALCDIVGWMPVISTITAISTGVVGDLGFTSSPENGH